MSKTYFVNPNDTGNTRLHTLIRQWVQDALKVEEPFDLTVDEIKCADPGCPDVDTYITLSKEGESKRYRIAKPLVYVRKWDIEGMREVKKA